jgi:hypothetical protein
LALPGDFAGATALWGKAKESRKNNLVISIGARFYNSIHHENLLS